MDYMPSTEVYSADTEGMDSTSVQFYMYKTSESIEQYDKNEPEFKWFQIPAAGQMTVNLLLDTFDQTRTTETRDIFPPRGLSSINKLSLVEASHYSVSGKTSGNLIAKFDVPDFSFLPIDQESVQNSGYLTYTNSSAVIVHIEGQFLLSNEEVFNVYFNKDSDSSEYTINFISAEESTFTFMDLKTHILPTLTPFQNDISILPDQEEAKAKLALFGITEEADGGLSSDLASEAGTSRDESTKVSNVMVKITLEPVLIYTVTGKITSDIAAGYDISFTADFVNLDGSPYAYMQFDFQSHVASQAFSDFFSLQSVDGGYASFDVKGFNIVTTNRDLDLSQWESIVQDDDIDLHMEGGIIGKKGIKIKLDTTLIED